VKIVYSINMSSSECTLSISAMSKQHLLSINFRAFAVAGPMTFNALPDNPWDPSVNTATFGRSLRHTCSLAITTTFSASEVSHVMRYINLPYLLTYFVAKYFWRSCLNSEATAETCWAETMIHYDTFVTDYVLFYWHAYLLTGMDNAYSKTIILS